MKVTNNKAVTFHYHLRDGETRTDIENSRGGEPVACLIGFNNIIRGLEDAMLDKSAGDKFTVTLAPEAAYGLRQEGSEQRVPIKHLRIKKNAKLLPGMVVIVETQEGPRQATVVKAGKFNVDIDTNHPLAGKTLEFDLELVDVRDASEEEIAHGHVHGVGGHHH